ncbi:hypothetical protein AAFN86_24990 [Roseomonas sp. CAU 1739]|uniref:hypothetical protein n=1 Tax=Roseomonas sp. CAU 1739 TaxID=3140364 RepID=UPI00325B1C5B
MPSETAPPLDAIAPAAELHGLVDNAAPDRLYGWAWNAAVPQERVAVELRLASSAVFRTQANFARPDLAKAGIGDGCHAFEIPLEPDWIRRRAELAVVARAADGTEYTVPIRIRRAIAEAPEAGGQRTLEAVVASHRRIHEELRSIGTRLPEAGERAALDALLRTQQGMAEQLATLMIWLTRLEERLAATPAAPATPVRRGPDRWTVLLGVVLGTVWAGSLLLAIRLAGG